MKKRILIGYLILMAAINMKAQKTDFPKLTGPYLGQKPPGTTPEIFAPGLISTKDDEYALETNSSGNEILFCRKSKVMMTTRNAEGIWTMPTVAPFSGKYIDDEPFFSPGGSKIYFMSRRPAPRSTFASNLWVSEKKDLEWSEPCQVILPNKKTLHAPSIADNGTIYEDGIKLFRYENGMYEEREVLPSLVGIGPFVAPDESYIIFSARHPVRHDYDCFISFHRRDGTWSKETSLGDQINTSASEANAFVTADGKYLFFSRKFDIYWVSANIIEELRQKE
jgi:hypothetical protein